MIHPPNPQTPKPLQGSPSACIDSWSALALANRRRPRRIPTSPSRPPSPRHSLSVCSSPHLGPAQALLWMPAIHVASRHSDPAPGLESHGDPVAPARLLFSSTAREVRPRLTLFSVWHHPNCNIHPCRLACPGGLLPTQQPSPLESTQPETDPAGHQSLLARGATPSRRLSTSLDIPSSSHPRTSFPSL